MRSVADLVAYSDGELTRKLWHLRYFVQHSRPHRLNDEYDESCRKCRKMRTIEDELRRRQQADAEVARRAMG
jgi:hypothetical protein